MKRIRKSRAARIVSWLLAVAMITPLGCRILNPTAAQAQGLVQGGAQTVIVVDFANKSGFLGEALARRATDAVAVELANSSRFEVLKRDEIEKEALNLGLKKPYDNVALGRLAGALGAVSVVTGEIVYVRSAAKSNPKVVYAGLIVRVQDAGSVELTNGAATVGEARSRPGAGDDDSLAQEAVDNASVIAVKHILSTNLAEGTIVSTVGTGTGGKLQVLVNRGSRDGVAAGMEMLVTRERQRVGKLKVTNVFAADSEAAATENLLGIRPEDKVRVIFPLPPLPSINKMGIQPPRRAGTGSSIGQLGKVLVLLAAGAVIASAVIGGKNTSVTGVVAEASVTSGSPTVRITWRNNMWGGTTLEHQIWRAPDNVFNFQGNPVASMQYGNQYTEFAAPWSFWDGTRSFLRAPLPNTGGSSGGDSEAETVTPEAGAVLGFVLGRTYSYQISAVIRRPIGTANTGGNNGGGTGDTGYEDVGTEPVSSGPVTPINSPVLGPTPQDQAANVSLEAFNPNWLSVTGADVFQVEVSTDRLFGNKTLILQLPLVISTAPLANGATQILGAPVDLTASAVLKRDVLFANYVNRVAGAPKPTLYWRVGGRNTADKPGPVHWITKNHGDGDTSFRFVYSSVRSFTPADMPPPPP